MISVCNAYFTFSESRFLSITFSSLGVEGIALGATFFGLSLLESSRFSPNALWRRRTKLLVSGIDVIPPTEISNSDKDMGKLKQSQK